MIQGKKVGGWQVILEKQITYSFNCSTVIPGVLTRSVVLSLDNLSPPASSGPASFSGLVTLSSSSEGEDSEVVGLDSVY